MSNRLLALARLALARPRAVIAGWLAVIGVLALLGLGVEDRLHRSSLVIPGTASESAAELARERFGDSSTLVVLLRGPRAAIDAQGRRLAERLERIPSVVTLGPWAAGAGRALRPKPGTALVLVRVRRPFEEASRDVAPRVRAAVHDGVGPPVRAHVSGYADIANAIHGDTVEAVRRAELIAAPLLIIVLLLVFRSPIAAALPLLIGFTTIGAGGGVLELINRSQPLDVIALNLVSMMGLALGVDYSLLLVSRFREELAASRDKAAAAAIAVETAGRTVVFAGLVLALAMLTAFLVAPGDLLASASLGVVVATVISVAAALTALPAMLVLLGPAIDRWRLGSARSDLGGVGGLALRALRRPATAAALVVALVAALSVPALALQTGPPDPRVLPESTAARSDFEAISRTLGGGWTAPYEITVAARRGTITDARRLAALDRWQRQVAAWPGVLSVMGPGAIARRTRALGDAPRQLEQTDAALKRGLRDQSRLRSGLERAAGGVGELRAGLGAAADGAARLHAGGDQAADGAARLATGLQRARRGARRLLDGLRAADRGGTALARGGQQLRDGAQRLRGGLATARRRVARGLPRVRDLASGLGEGAAGLERLREPARIAERELRSTLAALDRMLPTSKVDPQYRRAYTAVATAAGAVTGRHPLTGDRVRDGYDGLDASLAGAAAGVRRAAVGARELAAASTALVAGLRRLEAGARRAAAGVRRLQHGARRLLAGLSRLERGGSELSGGLADLHDGARPLAVGVQQLRAGAGRLERGLAEGATRTGALRAGLGVMRDGTAQAQDRTRRLGAGFGDGAGQLAEPLRSGYFVLAALDSSAPARRTPATFAVNLDRGGSAAQIVVVGGGRTAHGPTARALRERIEHALEPLERDAGVTARAGGPATVLQDFHNETAGRLWLLVFGLCAVAYVVLVFVLRSLLLPALAVALNLLTVAAAFGALVVLFQGSAPLGGPGFLDAIMVSGIFSVVFGLSIDYQVFLLMRMREGYELTGTTDGAIAYGLRHTAGVVTGAALIMTGVFVAFALSDIASMRELGIGLTIAVLLDATVVRLVLLPAAIRLCGPAAWWMPRALARSSRAPTWSSPAQTRAARGRLQA